jgi:hypothetical protein
VLRVLPDLGSGAVECLAANLEPALGQKRVEARLLGLLDHSFGAKLKEILAEEVTLVCV